MGCCGQIEKPKAKVQQQNSSVTNPTPQPDPVQNNFVNDNINSQRAAQARNIFHRLRFGNVG